MKNCYVSINIILAMAMVLSGYNVNVEAAVDKAVESACSKSEFEADCEASITSKLGPVINEKEILLAGITVLEERAKAGIQEATKLRPTIQGDVQGMLMAAISYFTNVKVASTKAKDFVNGSNMEREVDLAQVKSLIKDANNSISHVNDIFVFEQNPVKSITLSMQMAARTALRLVPKSKSSSNNPVSSPPM